MARYICLKKEQYSLGDYSIVPLRYDDRFAIMKWRNEQIYHLRQARPLTEEDQQRYFDNVVANLYDQQQPDQILFSYLEKGVCIGYGGLVHINWIDSNAELSFIMDTGLEKEYFAEHWSNYLTMIKEVAFNDLCLHKIYTYAFDLRPYLYTVLESNGFCREANLKEHCFFEGHYKDVVIHSILNNSYQVVNYLDCSHEQLMEILNLRNRDDVRKWMVNSDVISEDKHFRFVETLKDNSNRLYYAIYKDGELMGTYNLTKQEEGIWERGIIANPITQGRGETEKWERLIISNLPKYGIKVLIAKVKQDNPRSLKYHVKLGYQEQSRDNEYIHYILRLQ